METPDELSGREIEILVWLRADTATGKSVMRSQSRKAP
jgi:hypothetical protein